MRKLLMLVFTAMLCYSINAQTTSINGLIGFSENGYSGMTNLHFHPKKDVNKYFELGGYASFLEEKLTGLDTPIEVYSLNIGYFSELPFLSNNNDSFSVSIGIGGVVGNETIDDSEIDLSDRQFITTEDGVIYGGYGAIEADIRITKHFSALGRYTHFYHANSEIAKSKFMIGLGLAIKL